MMGVLGTWRDSEPSWGMASRRPLECDLRMMSSRSMCIVAWIRSPCIFVVELCSTVWTSPWCLPIPPGMDTWAVYTSWLLRVRLQGRAEPPFSVLSCINVREEFLGQTVILGSSLWFLSTRSLLWVLWFPLHGPRHFPLSSWVLCFVTRRYMFSHFRKTIYIPECGLSPGVSDLFLRNAN